jgi:hypothetical protein
MIAVRPTTDPTVMPATAPRDTSTSLVRVLSEAAAGTVVIIVGIRDWVSELDELSVEVVSGAMEEVLEVGGSAMEPVVMRFMYESVTFAALLSQYMIYWLLTTFDSVTQAGASDELYIRHLSAVVHST